MKTCISCEHFAWWDGDYCCLKKMRILQPSKDGHFGDDILAVLNRHRKCRSYNRKEGKNIYLDALFDFLANKEHERK